MGEFSQTYVVLEKTGSSYEITADLVKYEGGVIIFKDAGPLKEPHAFVCIDSIYGVLRKDVADAVGKQTLNAS